jgi:hypothetical protein
MILLVLSRCASAQPPCNLAVTSDTQIFWFHVDVWPLATGNDSGDSEAHAGTTLESPVAVADRFRQKIAADVEKLCVVNIEYPLFTYYALRNSDQNKQNAPLAVQKNEDQGGKHASTDRKTMTEVWRHVCWTTDKTVRDKYLGTATETVVSDASSLIVISWLFLMHIALIVVLVAHMWA